MGMNGRLLLWLCYVVYSACYAATSDNDNQEMYRVYRVTPANESQLEFVTNVYKLQAEMDIDFWKAPHAVGAATDMMIQDRLMDAWLKHELEMRQIPYIITIDDVAEFIKERKVEHDIRKFFTSSRRKRASSPQYSLQTYGTYDDMLTYMRELKARYPNLVDLKTIGEKTYDGNWIYMLTITDPNSTSNRKRGVWIDGGIHAREWASPHTVMYFIAQLVDGYINNDADVRHYLRHLDFYIVPVANPDGYIYSMSSASPRVRLWRKNRNPDGRRNCFGVDLNRNFDFHWGETGSSTNACSEVYQGRSPFSEIESRAVRDQVNGHLKGKLDAFITMHTYSQIWIHPYGHERNAYPPDGNELYQLGRAAASKLSERYQTRYVVGSGADALYPAAGGSDDWAKSKAGIKYVYLLELRPDESHWDGFILEESQLLPMGRETWDAGKVVFDAVLKYNRLPTVPSKQQAASPSKSTTPSIGRVFTNNSNNLDASDCNDDHGACPRWVESNRKVCEIATNFMTRVCPKSCGRC